MLKPKSESSDELEQMTADKRASYEKAVAEEKLARRENARYGRESAKRLKEERQQIADLITRLRCIRQASGVSLNELETRTGISKSSLSRLENSVAPNPTLLTLQRYAAAVGVTLKHDVVEG